MIEAYVPRRSDPTDCTANAAPRTAEMSHRAPAMDTLVQTRKMQYSRAFYEAVARGNNFLDAFYLATRQQATAQAAASAQQRAMNNIRSKDHLKRTGMGSKPGATVTEEERRLYKLFNPGATDDQIQAFQNRVKKG